jgi:hypothetical protein
MSVKPMSFTTVEDDEKVAVIKMPTCRAATPLASLFSEGGFNVKTQTDDGYLIIRVPSSSPEDEKRMQSLFNDFCKNENIEITA